MDGVVVVGVVALVAEAFEGVGVVVGVVVGLGVVTGGASSTPAAAHSTASSRSSAHRSRAGWGCRIMP